MSSTAAAVQPGDRSLDLADWFVDAVEYAFRLAAVAATLGFPLYFAWNWGLSTLFSFTHDMSGLFMGPLVVLAGVSAYKVYKAARDHVQGAEFHIVDTLYDALMAAVLLGELWVCYLLL